MTRFLLFPIILLLFFTTPLLASEPKLSAIEPEGKVVILVRHAEKQQHQGKDPALTPAGEQRADLLRLALKEMPLSALYATPFKRTQATLKPISKSRDMVIKIMGLEGGIKKHIREGAKAIKAETGNVLVAGHSNTISMLITALGGPEIDKIAETDYNNIYILSISPDNKVGLIHTKYGD
ncbi:histidine phosphatase family protein [Shewanella nanhaiensis]|uniref:Histidine phosphatase family protein n=1 Tax=Shewanella nanhaiensis TaxID=2864872 RepID=A0ABS7E0Z0_9GAMM|nr:histidine phosphatase family protein [Shewanella nanhaiensis]MBW8183383.1 histidine phosphatase family protein [Shewanella nanhaiensis]